MTCPLCTPKIRRPGGLPSALASFCLAVLAGAACACTPTEPPPGQTLADHERQLAARAAECADNADYLAWHGAVLLALGQVAAAAERLERALLLDPQHPRARRDYARALAAMGAVAAARELEPEASGAALATAAGPRWRLGGELAFALGHDSNLNNAPRAEQLTLTLPDGPLTLPLRPEARARSAPFVQAAARLEAQRALPGGAGLLLLGRLDTRQAPAGEARDQGDFNAIWQWPADLGLWSAHAGLGTLRWRADDVETSTRLGLRHIRPIVPDCALALGGEATWRRFPAARTLDHTQYALSTAWLCDGRTPWSAQLAIAREDAAARPSGDAWRLGGLLGGARPFAHGRLEYQLRLLWRREAQGQSPLLANGAPLSSTSLALRLSYRQPLAARWALDASLEAERQQANLPLYRLRREALALALVYTW